jgi:hypothetical protein
MESVTMWAVRALGTANSEAMAASFGLINPDAMPNAKTDAAKPEPTSSPL